jgi:hypothetical protein
MSRERTTVSQRDMEKVLAALNSVGVKPVAVEIFPARVKMALSDGSDVTLPEQLGEPDSERNKENLGHGRKQRRRA